MKFTKLYEDVKASDLFKLASPEEVEKRQKVYPSILFNERLDSVKKTKLSDGTWHIHGNLDVSFCELTTLKNLNISSVDGGFYCHYDKLTSLEGAPTTVNGRFYCYKNKLIDLNGAPTVIGGDFVCSYNDLTTLEGSPVTVNGNFLCKKNNKKFTVEEVRAVCDVKGSIYT